MYKLTVTNTGYKFFQYDLIDNSYHLVVKGADISAIKNYLSKFMPGRVCLEGTDGIDQAIKDMCDSHYNTAEFGIRGYYTIPYFDKDVD